MICCTSTYHFIYLVYTEFRLWFVLVMVRCPACTLNPNCHSFSKIDEKDGVSTYYTCPAKAILYKDTKGILQHYEMELEDNADLPWVWTFDCAGFTISHATEVQTAIGICQILKTKCGDSLQRIIVINPTWHIHSLLYVIWPFMTDHVRSIIQIENN